MAMTTMRKPWNIRQDDDDEDDDREWRIFRHRNADARAVPALPKPPRAANRVNHHRSNLPLLFLLLMLLPCSILSETCINPSIHPSNMLYFDARVMRTIFFNATSNAGDDDEYDIVVVDKYLAHEFTCIDIDWSGNLTSQPKRPIRKRLRFLTCATFYIDYSLLQPFERIRTFALHQWIS